MRVSEPFICNGTGLVSLCSAMPLTAVWNGILADRSNTCKPLPRISQALCQASRQPNGDTFSARRDDHSLKELIYDQRQQ